MSKILNDGIQCGECGYIWKPPYEDFFQWHQAPLFCPNCKELYWKPKKLKKPKDK